MKSNRKLILFVLTGCFLIFIGTFSPDNKACGEFLSNGAEIRMTTLKEWVSETSLWATVTVKNAKTRQISGPISEVRPFSFSGYSYRLFSGNEVKVIAEKKYKPQPFGMGFHRDARTGLDIQPMRPHFKIKSQESIRLLFPIPWPMEAKITPGEYNLELTVHSFMGYEIGGTPTSRLIIRKLTEEESPIISAIGVGNGFFITRRHSDVLDRIELTESLKMQTGLGFEQVLYRLSTSDKPLTEFDEKELDKDFSSIFGPEISVLKYEILKAKGLGEEAARLRDSITDNYPGITYRFESVDKGLGAIEKLRMELDKRY